MVVAFNSNAVAIRRKRRDMFTCTLWDAGMKKRIKMEQGPRGWVDLRWMKVYKPIA